MPAFQLKDGFGLDVSITPAAGALSKYFKSVPDMMLSKIDLTQSGNRDLSDPAIRSATGDLSFSQSIDIGTSGVELKAAADLSGTLSIFVPDKDGAPLFQPDLFGDEIDVRKNERYISMTLLAMITADVSVAPGDLTFGFSGTSSVSLRYYQLFSQDDKKLVDAVEETVAHFAIPGDLDDIDLMPVGSIAIAEGTGNLKFTAAVNLLAATNPLASASLPVFGALQITGGATITVGGAFEFSGDYQVRVHKLAPKTFRLGFYRKLGSQFSISASARGSIAAKLGDSDLFVDLIRAISSDPKADLKALQNAGLSNDKIQDIQKAIKNAVDRSLAIGVSVELSSADAKEAMFLYEVDLNAIQPDGRALLHEALEGNLSGIVAANENLPRGVTLLKTLVSKTQTLQHALKVNLLGIYNLSRVSSLIAQGSVGWDRTTGELAITDQVSASRIGISTSNLETDSKKLRHVLAQQFLITAAYSAAANILDTGPRLSAAQSYFDLKSDASAADMRKDVLLAAALGLSSEPDALERVPQHVNHFGPATVYAEAAYDNEAFYSVFLDHGQLRDPSEYTTAARRAITFVVRPGDPDEARLLMATDDRLFADLCRVGNPSSVEFRTVLSNRGVPPAVVRLVGVDYLNVCFLRDALSSAGPALLAIRQFLEKNPHTDPGNHKFKELAAALSKHMAQVAQQATEDFGGPWGFCAMALLRRSATQKWLLVNAHVAGALETTSRSLARPMVG